MMEEKTMKVYGAEICIDCRNYKHIAKARNLDLEYIDITENTANLREFLHLRDKEKAFEVVKERGGIGIPAFVHEDKVTLDINEAFSWIGQKPVEEEEIVEKYHFTCAECG